MMKFLVGLLKGALILVLAMGVYALWCNVRPRPPIVDYQRQYRLLEERGMSAEARASSDNGYDLLVAAHERYLEITKPYEEPVWSETEGRSTSSYLDFWHWRCLGAEPPSMAHSWAVHDEVLKVMQDTGLLAQMVEASRARRFTVPFPPGGTMLETSYPGYSREVVKVLLYATESAVLRGDVKAADSYFGAACVLSRHFLVKPDLVSVLIGCSHVELVSSFAQHIAATPEMGPDELASIAQHLDALLPLPTLEAAAEGERLRVQEAFQSLIEGVPPRPLDVDAAPVWMVRVVHDRRHIEAQIGRLHELLLLAIRAPKNERQARIGALFDEADRSNNVLASMYNAWDKPFNSHHLIASVMAIRRLAVALERHGRASGRFPGSLDELVPAWIDAVPEDVFAPDDMFIYCPAGDGSSFVLYSVGRDGIDDGGVPPPEGSRRDLALEEKGAGYDYVVRGAVLPR